MRSKPGLHTYRIEMLTRADCISIDNTPNDAALQCARQGFPGTGRHGSTAEGFTNLLTCLPAHGGNGSFLGHADQGIIIMGTGDTAPDPKKYIAYYNPQHWASEARRIRGQATFLRLIACHPGAGEAGALLLYRLAVTINAPVSGPTGFVYCLNGQISYENGSVWQIATPQHKPDPIPPPTPYFTLSFDTNKMKIVLIDDVARRTLPASSVCQVEYYHQPHHQPAKGRLALQDEDARQLLAFIDFEHPFQPGGAPFALVTGRLILIFDDRERREFKLLNSLLAQDTENPTVFYRVDPTFGVVVGNSSP